MKKQSPRTVPSKSKTTVKRPLAPAVQKPKRSGWRRFVSALLWIFTIISALGLLGASFGGNFPPSALKGISIVELLMPLWIVMLVLATVLDIFWCRKALTVSVLTCVACAAAIWEFMPLNLTRPNPENYADCPKFTFLTYNVANFQDQTGKYEGSGNPTLSYILKVDADVVNLQECYPFRERENLHIYNWQIKQLYKKYPYVIAYGEMQMLLSKYPAEAVHVGEYEAREDVKKKHPDDKRHWGEIAVFRLDIDGEKITLFDVHLQSYGLSAHDKSLYSDITELKDADGSVKKNISDLRHQLFGKIHSAAVYRQYDADRLCRYIDKYAGPNAIVAGDFNDVPGCYTLRQLADHRFRQVYEKLGFGPMITFNADRFYFRIDHVLYRGNLQPLRMSRGNSRCSDHYPLLTTFALEKP